MIIAFIEKINSWPQVAVIASICATVGFIVGRYLKFPR